MVHEKVRTIDILMKHRSFDSGENDSRILWCEKKSEESIPGGWNVMHSKSTYGKDNHIYVTERSRVNRHYRAKVQEREHAVLFSHCMSGISTL